MVWVKLMVVQREWVVGGTNGDRARLLSARAEFSGKGEGTRGARLWYLWVGGWSKLDFPCGGLGRSGPSILDVICHVDLFKKLLRSMVIFKIQLNLNNVDPPKIVLILKFFY